MGAAPCAAPKPRNPSGALLAARTLNLGFGTDLNAGSDCDLGEGDLGRDGRNSRGSRLAVDTRNSRYGRHSRNSHTGTANFGVGGGVSLCVGLNLFSLCLSGSLSVGCG